MLRETRKELDSGKTSASYRKRVTTPGMSRRMAPAPARRVGVGGIMSGSWIAIQNFWKGFFGGYPDRG